MRIMAILLVLTALLSGCTGGPAEGKGGSGGKDPTPALPSIPPTVEGQITKQEGDRILVEAAPQKEEGAKCWFKVTATAAIAITEDGKTRTAGPEALKVGQKVRAWAAGPVLESYPCQGTLGSALIMSAGD